MLRFFRSNQFFVSFALALYVVLLHLGALLGSVQPVANPTESGVLYQSWFGWIANKPFYASLASTVLVFVQAFSVNILADEFRLMEQRNWFPGLFYALVASALPEFLFLSAPLVAATFIPISLWRIYQVFQKPKATALIFDAALWLSVASLFYPPALLLLLAAFLGLGVVRVFKLRERFVFMAGAFVPLFLGWVWCFWTDRGNEFRETHWAKLFDLYRFDTIWDEKMWINGVFVAALAWVFLFGLIFLYSRKSIQARKFVSVLYWFLGLGGLSILLRPAWHWEHLLLSAAAMGILLALTFQSFRHRFWAELWHLVFLAFAFLCQFSAYFLNLL